MVPTAKGIHTRGLNALLVVEIADSSLGYDRGRKAALYASFGVRELWVIDAVKRATRVFRKPSAEGYGETLDFGESDLLTPEFASLNSRCGSTNSSRFSSRGGDAGHGAKSQNGAIRINAAVRLSPSRAAA